MSKRVLPKAKVAEWVVGACTSKLLFRCRNKGEIYKQDEEGREAGGVGGGTGGGGGGGQQTKQGRGGRYLTLNYWSYDIVPHSSKILSQLFFSIWSLNITVTKMHNTSF